MNGEMAGAGKDSELLTPGISGGAPKKGPSGPRRQGEGTEEEEQEVVSIETLPGGAVQIRVTLLAAGFVIGASGSSVREIMQNTGAMVQSWTQQAGADGYRRPTRVFRVSGTRRAVQNASEIITEAVERYKELCEGKRRGEFVQRQQRVRGVEFAYQPPPRSAAPQAAALGNSGSSSSSSTEHAAGAHNGEMQLHTSNGTSSMTAHVPAWPTPSSSPASSTTSATAVPSARSNQCGSAHMPPLHGNAQYSSSFTVGSPASFGSSSPSGSPASMTFVTPPPGSSSGSGSAPNVPHLYSSTNGSHKGLSTGVMKSGSSSSFSANFPPPQHAMSVTRSEMHQQSPVKGMHQKQDMFGRTLSEDATDIPKQAASSAPSAASDYIADLGAWLRQMNMQQEQYERNSDTDVSSGCAPDPLAGPGGFLDRSMSDHMTQHSLRAHASANESKSMFQGPHSPTTGSGSGASELNTYTSPNMMEINNASTCMQSYQSPHGLPFEGVGDAMQVQQSSSSWLSATYTPWAANWQQEMLNSQPKQQ